VSKNLEVIKPKKEEVRESFSSMIECIFWSIYFFSLDLNTLFFRNMFKSIKFNSWYTNTSNNTFGLIKFSLWMNKILSSLISMLIYMSRNLCAQINYLICLIIFLMEFFSGSLIFLSRHILYALRILRRTLAPELN
jgi:hypothetical protein